MVPPARNALAGSAATSAIASSTAAARVYAERPHASPHRPNRRADVRIGRAAADVAAHELGDVLVAGGVALLDQLDRGHDLPGRAVAALERVVLDERALHRVQLVAVGEPFDRRDRVALGGERERQAGEHAAPVDPDRARAAGALVAALLGPGQAQVLAQRVEQARARFERHRARGAVDVQRDRYGRGARDLGWIGDRHGRTVRPAMLALDRALRSRHRGVLPVILSRVDLATLHERRSEKWAPHDPDVVVSTIAEMDFELAPPVAEALHAAIDRHDLGYAPPTPPRWRRRSRASRARRLRWSVDPEQVTLVPDVMAGLIELCRRCSPRAGRVRDAGVPTVLLASCRRPRLSSCR